MQYVALLLPMTMAIYAAIVLAVVTDARHRRHQPRKLVGRDERGRFVSVD